jgi:zinc protease
MNARFARGAFSLAVLAVLAAAGAPSPARIEKPEKFVLANGSDCLYHRDAVSPTTVVQVFVRGGRGAVPAGLDGLAYLATSLSLEIPDEGKARNLMAQATRMFLTVWEDCSVLHIECLSENLEAALRAAAEIIQNPLLTGIRIDRTKRTMRVRGRSEQDDAEAAAGRAARQALFGDRGYGTATFGTELSLRSIARKDVVDFRQRLFTRGGVFFSAGSDLGREEIRTLLEKHFAEFPAGDPADVVSPRPSLPEDRDIVLSREAKQTYLGRVFVLPAPDPAVYARGLILETAVGRGPGSRLWSLRTTGKLAYNVNARTVWTRTSGLLEAYLETESAKAEIASAALDEALEALHREGLSEEEFEAAKATAGSSFLRSIETKPSRTRAAGMFEVLGLGHGYLAGVFEAIDSVTLADMNEFIRETAAPVRALRVRVGSNPFPGPAAPGARDPAS